MSRIPRARMGLLVAGVASIMLSAHGIPATNTLRAQNPLPPGFTDTIVLSGFNTPTVVGFAPDGRVFVGEKSGLVKVFDSLADPSPSIFADLRTQVHNYADRGLLGLAVDPQFPARPYIYVLYTRDAPIGGTAPRWGTPNATSDTCPDPPGMTDGCVASARLSRLQAVGNVWTGTEHVLVDDWFQQFDSHSMGALAFGPDGALYASGGEAASWQFVDYGQRGMPLNPNGDPPVPVGALQTPPSAEGGALRAQDLRTPGDPVGLNGTLIRIHPDTGAGLPDNPLASHPDPNARRIVAYGMRNPFRFAVRPGTREVWVGDVGWREFEEINIVPAPTPGVVRNFGWPCYDGTLRQDGFDAANLDICEDLYAEPGAVTFAYFQYRENVPVVSGEPCIMTDQSMSGMAFYQGGSYPDEYDGALFFADYTRRCIWVMPQGTTGVPDRTRVTPFIGNAAFPVDLKVGPGGDLYYVDIVGGTIRRISYTAGNAPPVAVITASALSGHAPLLVSFDGTGSQDPEAGTLTYSWDLNGDGSFGDSTSPTAGFTFAVNGSYTVRLRVTDPQGLQDVEAITVTVGNTGPVAVIDSPTQALRWRTGSAYTFSGRGTDPEDGTLPATSMNWTLVLNHCSSSTSCHEHPLQDYTGVAGGTFVGPEHEYPSYLALRLTVTDSAGLRHTTMRRLDPQAVSLTIDSRPSGIQVALGGESFVTPATRTVIAGSTNSISAASPQILGNRTFVFSSWSDGGAQTHLFRAGDGSTLLIATFTETSSSLPAGWTSQDVGAAGLTGSATGSGSSFTVRGAGADVWGAADAFRYVYRPLTGDGTIVARVASLAGIHDWVKVGVMIRGSVDPGAPQAFMLVSKNKGPRFQWRTAQAGSSLSTPFVAGVAPQWVRLVRRGQVITGSLSADGVTWLPFGSDTFAIGPTALVGLAVSSHDASQLATGTFDNVSVTTGTAGLPDGWTSRDIGVVGSEGSASASSGTFTIKGAGADIWGTADAFHYVYRQWSGDGTITARVASTAGSHAWTKVGVMIRGSLAPESPHAFMLVSTGKGLAFQRRLASGGVSTHTQGPFATAPYWVRLTRSGATIIASVSTDGSTWTVVGSDGFAFGATVYVGLAVTSHDAAQLATGVVSNVVVQ